MQRFKGMLNNLEESKLEIVEYEDANNQSILHDIKELKNAFAGNSSREKPAQSKRNREQPQSSNVSFLFNSKVWNGDTWKEDNPSEFIKKFQNLKQNLKKDSNLQDDKMKVSNLHYRLEDIF